ncbi:prepilin-type N-terminal cleavage/methylation domain-containing protein [Lysinibacillus sp. NPDC097287]|uniref:prepilin-type N-terminal cleavage/methylation domain-containing protein n=1 Tax=Lysinibacillus sp. NPDC097287 TaxID=3364144 RepID=UPI00381523C9
MEIPTLKHRLNESGLSLVEVVAAIVIISIILISFFSLFISTAKTTKTSSKILDATYYAQQEMEKLYSLSQNIVVPKKADNTTKIQIVEDAIIAISAKKNYKKSVNNPHIFFKEGDTTLDPNNKFYYELKFNFYDHSKNLTRFVIFVYDKDDTERTTPKAQMENIFEWRAR